ncbi:hypothetical protein FR943_16855 [Mycobacterium sp. TNTM28]|uniref:Cadherin domain-containing protein n=1 Tax=[Mycobacterium] fortunisiensis TaxID=2600579 RepID=A0ABS6KPG5_9MYCO|nr:VCBS domain-containing protein [[Mycobacterium] fortunisiensis]MBU9765510.1 hypothetical protein [[Mycobacterium] fortunisiensis]
METPEPAPLPAAAPSTAVATAAPSPVQVAAAEPRTTGFQAVLDDVLETLGLSYSAKRGSSPIGPVDTVVPAAWLASRQLHSARNAELPAATITTSDVLPDAAVDPPDLTEIADLAVDLIGRVPVVGALVRELHDVATSSQTYSVTAAAAVPTDGVTTAAATAAATDAAAFNAVIQRAVDRLAGVSTWIWHQLTWPGPPHQFVDVANNQIDRVLDAADDQLDALIAAAPAGTPAQVVSDFVDILHFWMAPAVPNYSFSDTLNAMGDFLNRVVPPFNIVDGAGTLSIISVYKIMGAAVAGTATALSDMLNGVYDLQQIEIDVIRVTTGATVTRSDLTNLTTLGTKVAASILVGGGAYSNPSKVLSETTLPVWTAEQVNPFTIMTYVALVGMYKRFQEIANFAKFTTNTTYESWIYTVDLGSASTRSQYAAGSFHAYDQDGRPVNFQPADGLTYTSKWGALVTINTYDGGYTYTATLPGEDYFHAGAAGEYDTVTIPVYTADGAPYDITFQVKIIDTENSTPTVTNSVGSGDALGVVRGTAAGSDADGDTLTYSLVGSSVTGLSGNSAYTTNGGIVTLDPSTGDFTYASTSTGGSSASFQVQVNDGHGGLTTTTVTVPNTAAITPANLDTSTQGVVTGALPAPTADAGMFSYALGSGPSYGTLSFNPATGAFTYTRTATDHSTPAADSFTVIATDANGRTVTLKVPVQPTVADTAPTLTLTTAPTVGTLSGSTDTTGSATSTQTTTGKFTSTDDDGDTVTYSASTGSLGGTLTFNSDGNFTYTGTLSNKVRHAAAKIGATAAQMNDTFTVTASDGYGGTATYTLNVPIYALNSAPTVDSWGVTHLLVTIGTAVKVSDADGDLTSNSKPHNGNANDGTPWYTFSRSTNTFNWYGSGGLQDFSASGTGDITFTVGDGYYVVVNGVVTGTPSSASKTG